MRTVYYTSVVCGLVLAAVILALGLWSPLLILPGLLISPLPHGRGRNNRQWQVVTTIEKDCNYPNKPEEKFACIQVACQCSGQPHAKIDLIDIRRDDFEDRLAKAVSTAEYKCAVLNSTAKQIGQS